MNNILPTGYKGFMIHDRYRHDYEAKAIMVYCTLENIEYKFIKSFKDYDSDYIPIGNIDFIIGILGYNIRPNYYPQYLQQYIKRNIWESDEWPIGRVVFIKPSDKYKRFTGFITNGRYRGKKRGPYICSDVIKVINEWRYYITHGEILYSRWYSGIEEGKVAPELGIIFDKDLCSCLDMGEVEGGDVVLIETQHPFSCGWYGRLDSTGCRIYAKWCANGWEYLKNLDRVV